MTTQWKKIIALLSALVLAIASVGLVAFAEEAAPEGEVTVQEEVVEEAPEHTDETEAAEKAAEEEEAAKKAEEEAEAAKKAEEEAEAAKKAEEEAEAAKKAEEEAEAAKKAEEEAEAAKKAEEEAEAAKKAEEEAEAAKKAEEEAEAAKKAEEEAEAAKKAEEEAEAAKKAEEEAEAAKKAEEEAEAAKKAAEEAEAAKKAAEEAEAAKRAEEEAAAAKSFDAQIKIGETIKDRVEQNDTYRIELKMNKASDLKVSAIADQDLSVDFWNETEENQLFHFESEEKQLNAEIELNAGTYTVVITGKDGAAVTFEFLAEEKQAAVAEVQTGEAKPEEDNSNNDLPAEQEMPEREALMVDDSWKEQPTITSIVSNGGGKVTVKWSGKSQSAYIYEAVNKKTKAIQRVENASQVTLTGITNGTHTYTVVPCKKVKEGGREIWTYGTRSRGAKIDVCGDKWKNAPTITKITSPDVGKVHLVWSVGDDANQYFVFEYVNGKKVTPAVATVTGVKECDLEGVSAGTHTYAVVPRASVAVNLVGGKYVTTYNYGKYSALKSVKVMGDWKKQPTVTSIVSNGGGSVTVKWTGEADNYYIYELNNLHKTKPIQRVTNASQVTLTGVTNGTHSYNVVPCEKVGAGGSWAYGTRSRGVKIDVCGDKWVNAPTIKTITQTGPGKVHLEWTVGADASQYFVFEYVYNSKTKNWDKLTPAVATVTGEKKCDLEGVSVGTHSYAVVPRSSVAVNQVGDKYVTTYKYGKYSARKTIKVQGDWKGAPTITEAKNTAKGKVELKWEPEKDAAAEYLIYEYLDGKATQIDVVTGALTWSVTGVTPGKHTYCVRPRQKEGEKYVNGTSSQRVDVDVDLWAVAPVVELTQDTEVDGIVKLAWNANEEAEPDNFIVYEFVEGKNNALATLGGTELEYTVTDVKPGTHYYFVRPRKKNAAGTNEYGDPSETKDIFVKIISTADVGDFTYGIIEGAAKTSIQVLKYNGADAEVTVPGKILEDYYTVTQIGASAFEDNDKLTTIHLPATITVIGQKAFKNCVNLANMD